MNQIRNLKQLFSISEDKLNILEEEIDVQVQKEYFSLLNKLSKDTNAYTQLTKTYIENINDLLNIIIGFLLFFTVVILCTYIYKFLRLFF